MNNKSIVFSTIFFLLISFIFLSLTERKNANINNQDIWMLYFENPQGQSLDFKIENHSSISNFHWQIFSGKAIIKEGNTTVLINETKKIQIPISNIETASKKITVTVSDGAKVKELYKNL